MFGIFVDLKNSMTRILLIAFEEKEKAEDYLLEFEEKASKINAIQDGFLNWDLLNNPEWPVENKNVLDMLFPRGAYFGCGGPATNPYLDVFELGKPIIPYFDLD